MPVSETRVKITADNRTKGVFNKVRGDIKKTNVATKKLVSTTKLLAGAYIALRGIGAVAGIWKNFGATIADLSAITGATGKDLEFLKRKSLEFGAATTLSASQAAEAFKLVASAKPDLLENAEALSRVTKEAITLAEASGSTLPDAARTLGVALNQYGVGAEEASRFINVLAAGSKRGASEIADTSEAIKVAGLVAAGAGTSFEEMNAALQIMSLSALKGSEAGTGLRNIYLNLANQSNNKFKPELVGLTQAMKNIKDAGLSTTEMLEIFGKRNIVTAKALINNSAALVKMRDNLTNTTTAYDQAAIKVDNLDGDWKKMGSTWETTALILGETFDPAMRGIVKVFTRVGQWISTIIVGIKGMGNVMASFAAQAAALLSGDLQLSRNISQLRDEALVSMEKELDLIWQTNKAKKDGEGGEDDAAKTDRIAKLKARLAIENEVKAAARTAEFQKAYAAEELALNDKYAMGLFKLEESLLSEDERLALARENREFMVEDAFQTGLINDERRNELLLQLKKEFEDKKTDIEDKATKERHKIQQRMLGAAAGIFGTLSSIMSKSGKKQNSASRAMARISIGISTAQAVMNALAVPPYPLGIALAVGAGLKGAQAMSEVGGGSSGISGPTGTPTNTSPIAPPPNADGFGPQGTGEVVNVTINGSMQSSEGVRDLIELINEEIGDGAEIKVTIAS